jgi:hypothetical protein
VSGYSAQAIYHIEIAENVMRNQDAKPDEYSTDQPLIYSSLVEMYFTLGRALTAEKKYPSSATAFIYYITVLLEKV